MKNILTITLFLIAIITSAQTISEINAVLGILDSLEHSSEIRIYKRHEITNGTDVFRLFKIRDKEWETGFFTYYHPLSQKGNARFDEVKLRRHNTDETLAWMKIMITNIDKLPAWNTFQHKLESPKIVYENGQYTYSITTHVISDGVTYKVFVRSGNTVNQIEYSNPVSYLESCPGVDELEMFSQMLNTIKQEFSIWKDER